MKRGPGLPVGRRPPLRAPAAAVGRRPDRHNRRREPSGEVWRGAGGKSRRPTFLLWRPPERRVRVGARSVLEGGDWSTAGTCDTELSRGTQPELCGRRRSAPSFLQRSGASTVRSVTVGFFPRSAPFLFGKVCAFIAQRLSSNDVRPHRRWCFGAGTFEPRARLRSRIPPSPRRPNPQRRSASLPPPPRREGQPRVAEKASQQSPRRPSPPARRRLTQPPPGTVPTATRQAQTKTDPTDHTLTGVPSRPPGTPPPAPPLRPRRRVTRAL